MGVYREVLCSKISHFKADIAFQCQFGQNCYEEFVNNALPSLYLAEQVENGLDIYEISVMSEMNARMSWTEFVCWYGQDTYQTCVCVYVRV